jgi:hypothetical protein
VAATVVVLVVAAVVLVWFQPQKLLIDDRVEERAPVAAAPAGDGVEAPQPRDLARSQFVSRSHGTSGVVRVIELPDGQRVVRLEGLDTDNGPDLYLYLSTNPPDGEARAFDDEFVDLGRLKGNIGDQNYEVPSDATLGRYRSVVIWCDRFDVAFGAAALTVA